jgi:hypothetical protein
MPLVVTAVLPVTMSAVSGGGQLKEAIDYFFKS